MKKLQAGSALRSGLMTIAVIVVLLGIAVYMLPKGFNDDLAMIGRGSNVVVLIQNKGAQQSMDLVNLLNDVRDDYEGKVIFLIADSDTPEGKAFAQQQQLDSSVLVFFAPDGTRLNVIDNKTDERGLRTALDNTFRLAR
jgi:hypothetical protein